MSAPFLSILLPVYNGEKYLSESIGSILTQSYQNFELIIINDGSTDCSASVVSSFNDYRIRYFEQKNHGLAATLNKAISLSRGEYLARQDQDDLSYAARLEKQVRYLDSHPACGMVGTWAEIWKEGDRTSRAHRHPTDNSILQLELLFNNPFVHSSMMFRKTVFDRVGQYSTDKRRQPPEDYELWTRISRKFEIGNIDEILHVYREAAGSMSREGWDKIMNMVVTLSVEHIALITGLSPDDRQLTNLTALANGVFQRIIGVPRLLEMQHIFIRATEAVKTASCGDPRIFAPAAALRWRNIKYNYFQYWFRYPLYLLSRNKRISQCPIAF